MSIAISKGSHTFCINAKKMNFDSFSNKSSVTHIKIINAKQILSIIKQKQCLLLWLSITKTAFKLNKMYFVYILYWVIDHIKNYGLNMFFVLCPMIKFKSLPLIRKVLVVVFFKAFLSASHLVNKINLCTDCKQITYDFILKLLKKKKYSAICIKSDFSLEFPKIRDNFNLLISISKKQKKIIIGRHSCSRQKTFITNFLLSLVTICFSISTFYLLFK